MPTTHAELISIWNASFREHFPDTETLDSSINLVTWATAATDDPLANLLADLLINMRTKTSLGFEHDLSDAGKLTLYGDVLQQLNNLKAVVDAIQADVDAAYTLLLP